MPAVKTRPRNVCRWALRPNDQGRGVLAINGVEHAVEIRVIEYADNRPTLSVRLLTPAGHVIRLTQEPDDGPWGCDCGAEYGPLCDHARAVGAALRWLDERQRIEWETAAALRGLAQHADAAAF